MEHWSYKCHAFAVESFFKNNDSATQTQCEFRKHFNIGRNCKVLTRQTILNWVRQFRSTASALPKKNLGHPRSVCIPENAERVQVALQHSPWYSATDSLRWHAEDYLQNNGAHLADVFKKYLSQACFSTDFTNLFLILTENKLPTSQI
jgi:hypothetical protein